MKHEERTVIDPREQRRTLRIMMALELSKLARLGVRFWMWSRGDDWWPWG